VSKIKTDITMIYLRAGASRTGLKRMGQAQASSTGVKRMRQARASNARVKHGRQT
jgi:hypothetical protein